MWPILFEGAGYTVYSYPFFIGLAWGVGYRLARAHIPDDLSVRHLILWFVGVFIVSWLGAKIAYLVVQDQWSTSELMGAQAFWLGGGFVFLGGLIASMAFATIIGRLIPTLAITRMSFVIPALLWSHAIGRLGCFLAGCCYGSVTLLPWGIHLHDEIRHPVQLYEFCGLAVLAMLIQKLPPRGDKRLIAYLLGYGVLRWVLECFRGDELRGFWGIMSTSQWLSLGMVLMAIILFWRRQLPKNMASRQ